MSQTNAADMEAQNQLPKRGERVVTREGTGTIAWADWGEVRVRMDTHRIKTFFDFDVWVLK